MIHFAKFNIFYSCKSTAMKFGTQYPEILAINHRHNFPWFHPTVLHYYTTWKHINTKKLPCLKNDSLYSL